MALSVSETTYRFERCSRMPALPSPHPMVSFDPTQPALVHDQLNDKVFEWKPEWASTWHNRRDHAPGVFEWDGRLLDGWEPL